MTEVMVLRELRALLRKKGAMLMSMLGVLLSDEGRQFLKSQGIGLKAFFQRVEDEFVVEGKKGEEKVIWLHPKNGTQPQAQAGLIGNTMSCVNTMDVPMNGIQPKPYAHSSLSVAHHERSKVSAPLGAQQQQQQQQHPGFKLGGPTAHHGQQQQQQQHAARNTSSSLQHGGAHHLGAPHGKERSTLNHHHHHHHHQKHTSGHPNKKKFSSSMDRGTQAFLVPGALNGGVSSGAGAGNFTPAVITTRGAEARYGDGHHVGTSGPNSSVAAQQHQHRMAVPHVLWPTCY